MNKSSLTNQAHNFLERAFAELERKDFTLDKHWHIDHFCFRTSTKENYLSTKKQFENFSKLLIESEVNGRLISTFKLQTCIVFLEWEIDLIEVPAPKKGKTVADGFALKIHHLSLESVINVEANDSIFSALKSSDILKILKPFGPLVAGIFPLNVNVAGSDVDILISGDMNRAKEILQEKFSDLSYFKCDELIVQGEPTLLISFSYQGIEFEIFGQKTPSIRQQ